ncbi:MAG: hemerythrin domain-containing protein [Candidatus Scalinduaceae bacterium]
MSALIDELKKEHSGIIATLNEVKEIDILSKEGHNKLMSVNALLLTHLQKEDEQLYPVLRKEAENDKQLEHTLNLYAMDMENVSRAVLEFFDKYFRGKIPDKELQKEFENLSVALSKRIRNEEDILYDEYEMMNLQYIGGID